MHISAEKLLTLSKHKGYGIGNETPAKVKTLIIGNESGTGNALNVEEFIKHIEGKEYLKKTETGSALLRSPFLQFSSRLVHALEDKPGQWFSPKDSCDVWNLIQTESFFSDTAHLVDIRPLPRPTESVWPYENINQKNYLNGFNTFKSKDPVIENLIQMKVMSLRNQIQSYPNLKYIIAPGAAQMKLKFLQLVFPQIDFQKETIQTSRKNMTYFLGTRDKCKIVISPFFDSKNGIGYEGLESLYNLLTT